MEVDYNKKIELCKKLGAEKFQKVVFKVEQLKYKTLKKIYPNFIKYYDKFCDFKRDQKLKKAKDDNERKNIINSFRKQKILVRREFNREENRNYHMNINKPLAIFEYLEWNKKIHVQGLIQNAINIPILTVLTILWTPVVIPLLVYELASVFINLQCINIQNYNIYRLKQKESVLQKRYERTIEKNLEKYGEASEIITKTLNMTEEIPTPQDVINNVTTKEELEQLRELVKANMKKRKDNLKQKKLGSLK